MPQVVLVTGCSTGGIGYALCEEFAHQGCKVYATSRCISTIADFHLPPDAVARGGSVEKLQLDVTSDENVQRVLDLIVEREGKVDVVVNNAGMIAPGPVVEQSTEHIKQIFDINTVSIMRICSAVVPIMAQRHSGTIVNIGSVVGEIATPWNGLYCATKAAVHSISETLSMELYPLGIRVMHVAPGAVKSNLASNASKIFELSPTSLYSSHFSMMIKRINASQRPGAMQRNVFAKKVVGEVMKLVGQAEGKTRMWNYLSVGGGSRLFAAFKWFPKGWILKMLWRAYSRKG